MLAYAERLTHDPASTGDAETDELRRHGFDDAQLWEIAYTTAIFASSRVWPKHSGSNRPRSRFPPSASTTDRRRV